MAVRKSPTTRKRKAKRAKKTSKAKRPMMLKTTNRRLAVVASNEEKKGMTIYLDQLLSQSNNKLYRQGMNYHAKVSIALTQLDANRSYSIYTLPTDHRTIGALRMAKSIYNQAMRDELQIRPSVKSKWTDFKMELCNVSDLTLWPPLICDAYATQWRVDTTSDKPGQIVKLINDDYGISQITDNAGNQKTFSLSDNTATNYWNVFSEYTNFLLNRADPDSTTDTAAYEDASPVLTELEELADKGDMPPYSWAWQAKKLDGTVVNHKFNVQLAGVISPDAGPRALQEVFVQAPLGMIFVVSDDDLSTTVPELVVELMSGSYKGVKADRIYSRDKLLGF